MAIVPRLPKIPRIKLPKLPKLKLGIPVFAIAGLTIAARAKLICSLVTAVFSPLQKIFQQLSDLSGTAGSIQAKVSGVLNSVKNLIKNQVTNLVNQAVAPITQALKAISNLPGSFVSAFKNAKESLSKQSASVKSIIEGELNCISENLSVSNKVSSANSTIKKTALQEVDKLTNNEKKEILENPVKKEEFVNNVTEKAVTNTTAAVTSELSNTNATQVKAVNKLETLKIKIKYDTVYEASVTSLKKSSRQELLSFLRDRMSNNFTIYTNVKFPDLRIARLKEIARIEEDLKNYPNIPKFLYIENDNYIIEK